MQPPIKDYAMIGNGRSAALISKSGSMDWLCWPRFDSPSIFGRILDPDAGHWSLAPEAPFTVQRKYLPDSWVLETEFQTGSGTLVLLDTMTVSATDRDSLIPEHEILRVAQCRSGMVDMVLSYAPRPEYGKKADALHWHRSLGMCLQFGSQFISLRCSHALEIRPKQQNVHERIRLQNGEAVTFSLVFASELPAVFPPLNGEALHRIRSTTQLWRDWAQRAKYHGPFREQVVRSALVLKSLVYCPSGAIVAAPTTSLPERLGGDLNWDYRFCWLRDASFTTRALHGLGFDEEARAYVSWLLHATRLTRPRLKVLYDVYGRPNERERVLSHLRGYNDSHPVRIGNAAWKQFQLDTYGEVIDAAVREVHLHGSDSETRKLLKHFGFFVAENWRHPDQGIWEPREAARRHTHSSLLCWTAMDRLCGLFSNGTLKPTHTHQLFQRERAAIRKEIELKAWNARLRSYVQSFDSNVVDASLYLIALHGFEPPRSDRMLSTISALEERLVTPRGLVYRYEQSHAKNEGAFGICGFWRVQSLAMAGFRQKAEDAFRSLLGSGNDLDLFAEEVDPADGAALGNFPQAFTHIGLINAALTLWPPDREKIS